MNTRLGLLSILFIVLVSFAANAQPDYLWYWEIDGGSSLNDRVQRSIELDDGSIVSVGFTNSNYSAGDGDGFMMKYDAAGQQLWNNVYEFPEHQSLNYLIQAADGGFILIGSDASNVDKAWVVRTDEDGEIIWTTNHGAGTLHGLTGVIETTSGEILLVGSVTFGSNDDRLWAIMLESDGTTIWDRTYHFENLSSLGNGVVECEDGNFIIGGCKTLPAATDAWLMMMKIDDEGETIWTEEYQTEGILSSWIHSMKINEDYEIIIGACYIPNTLLPRTGLRLMRLNCEGDVLLDRFYYSTIFDNYCFETSETSDGGYLVVGHSAEPVGQQLLRKMYLIKTDANGDTLTTLKIGQDGYDSIAFTGFPTSDGNIYCAGETKYGEFGPMDMVMFKIPDPVSPVLELSLNTIVFDTVQVEGEEEIEELTFTNAGFSPLVISGLSINEPFAHDFILPDTLLPEESITANVSFSPLSNGEFADTLFIESNSASEQVLLVTGVCDVNSVDDNTNLNPYEFDFKNPYPNPFNGTTNLSFILPVKSKATLNIYNALGQIVNSRVFSGSGQEVNYQWSPGRNASGIYYIQLDLHDSDKLLTHKVIYTK